jgi:hypothetical protein
MIFSLNEVDSEHPNIQYSYYGVTMIRQWKVRCVEVSVLCGIGLLVCYNCVELHAKKCC